MIIPVTIDHDEIEEVCHYDEWEQSIVCDDLDTTVETTPEYVDFEDGDIEEIVAMYLDDIIDILLNKKEYRRKLKRRLGCKRDDEEREEDN